MTQRCEKCGSILPAGVLSGHCPQCLVHISLVTGLAFDSDRGSSELFPRPFGRYELLGEIARGGMGVVYRARQPALRREVALKLTLSGQFASRAALDRFQAEARAVASLQHPHIVAIHEVGEEEGQPYFTMDFIEGSNLAELIRAGPLPPKQAARYVKEIAAAIHYTHGRGILHRDLKPSNVLIDAFDQPRVTDFGLAKQLSEDPNLTVTGQALGSPSYMAPEQALQRQSEIGVASDVYSLGALLYHLVSGRAPFVASTVAETLHQLVHDNPPPPRLLNPSVPTDLETICLKCLEKEPARRYASAQAVAEELSRYLCDQSIQARPISQLEKIWRWCRRNRSLAAALSALVAAFVLGMGGVLWQWRRAEQSQRTTRLNLYAADAMAASQAIERGDLGLGQRLLEAHIPRSGETDLRGFEWRFLWQRSHGQQRATLTGHTWIVSSVAFSSDGKLLASGSHDGTVRLWNPAESRLVATLRVAGGAVWSASFSPEGDLLVTGDSEGKIQVWNVSTGQRIGHFAGQLGTVAPTGSIMAVNTGSPLFWEPAGTVSIWDYRTNRKLREFPDLGKGLAISADGKMLAVAGRTAGLRLWDIASGKLVRSIDTEDQVWSLEFSPNGKHLICGSHRAALVWSLPEPGEPVKLVHPLTVWSAGFSPDGKTIVTASSDRIVRLWDTASLKANAVRRGHADEVWCAVFSPDGKSLATGSKDQTVKIWSAESEITLQPTRHTQFEKPLFSPDGSRLLTHIRTNDQIQSMVWQVATRSRLAVSADHRAIGFHPDGHHLIRLAWDKPALQVWSLETQAVVKSIPLNLKRYDGEFLRAGLSADSKLLFGVASDGMVNVMDLATGQSRGSFHWVMPKRTGSGSTIIRSAALTTDGGHFAISTEEGNALRLFDVHSGRETTLPGHRDFVSGLAFSPDGSLLATASVDAAIKLWDVARAKELATLTGHMEEATDVAFSPDGRTLASMGHLNTVKFWHVATRREIMSLSMPNAGYHLCFSPDGRHLAVTLSTGEKVEAVQILSAPTLAEMRP